MVSPTEGWISAEEGTILHYVDGAWQVESLPTREALFSFDVHGPDDVWAGGASLGQIMHYDGSAWSVVDDDSGCAPPNAYLDLEIVSFREGWAFGGICQPPFGGNGFDMVRRLHDGRWRTYLALEDPILAADMLSADHGWAFGMDGTVYRFGAVERPVSFTIHLPQLLRGW
jgi:hypothetical protein